MKSFALDWATKREFTVCNVKTGKTNLLSNNIEKWEKWLKSLKPSKFYLEEGGGDSFKLLARKLRHKVFTVPGIVIKKQRDKYGLKKDDSTDAFMISKVAKLSPNLFREFVELDETLAKIYLIFKMREKTEKNLVIEKNRLFAIGKQLELLDLGGYDKKLIVQQKKLVKSLQEKFKRETFVLQKQVHNSLQWKEFFESIKGCGEVAAGGIMSSIKKVDRFPTQYHLRSFAGMKKLKGNQNFSHPLKRALYFFSVGVIKSKNKKWYRLYKKMKRFYAKKNPDWSKGKIDNYARKFIQTKLLDEYYDYTKDKG